MDINNLIDQFLSKKEDYEKLGELLHHLIDNLLDESGAHIHTISHRIKEENSLMSKILNKGEKYASLNDITDILGIRIISYFEDDVKNISEIIKTEFKVDDKNSEDKIGKLDYNQFGYRSVHYICSLNSKRAGLKEYKKYYDFKFEIQIRSLLQHGWAEIEHDLGYKNEIDIPVHLKRDFSRISGLLELADLEFIRIKESIKTYFESIDLSDKGKVIAIDKTSITKYLKDDNNLLHLIDYKVAKHNRVPVSGHFKLTQMLEILNYLGISDINMLNEILSQKQDQLFEFSWRWIKGQRAVSIGISIWTLAYIINAEKSSKHLEKYFTEMQIGTPTKLGKNVNRVLDTLQEIKDNDIK